MYKQFVEENTESMFQLLKALCGIPAPSHKEENRAAFCKKWLEDVGATGVYIDEALNVIFPLGCEGSDEITIFAAHTDTVFPDLEPMPYVEDDEKIYSPGVADDTASVVVLMHMAKYFVENKLVPEKGIMFVCNSCEEGLGNLKGTRQLFKDFDGRIKQFITFDAVLKSGADVCVGSHRYSVEVKTQGGHSFGAFGNKNALAELSKIITEIYKIEVPEKEGTKTTYNVGTVEGGTAVNTIAQRAKMFCEYRSDDRESLATMQAHFERIFEAARTEDVSVEVTLVGERPCANIDRSKVEALKEIVAPIYEEVLGEQVGWRSGSTDCNIPLSLGVPALSVGTNNHAKIHTREEWVEKASIPVGLDVAIRMGKALTEV